MVEVISNKEDYGNSSIYLIERNKLSIQNKHAKNSFRKLGLACL